MNKKDLSERDICTKFISPAVKRAGWDEMTQVREEVSFTKGRIIVRGKLVTRGKDSQAFRQHASFYLQHLPRLTTRPEHIKQLRHNIHDLAVRGRLTAHWRETTEIRESAQDYLESILEVRKRLWDGKQISGTKRRYSDPVDYESGNLPTVPNSWVWASGDAVCSQITDGEHIQPPYQKEGLPMLTAKHVRDGYVTFDGCELIAESDFRRCEARCKPENGDILVVSVGATTGRAAVVNVSRPFVLVRSVLLLKPLILAQFFLRWLQSPWCFKWMGQASEASAQPHLYIGDTKRMPVAVPPLVEQHRIVSKVNELMALCDQLEAQLTTTQSESRRLLESVLYEALSVVRERRNLARS